MTDAPPTSPARPTLEQQPWKPDIVERLRVQHEMAESRGFPLADCFTADLADAIATITGLRESDQRRLQLINQAKGERDEARNALRAFVEWIDSKDGQPGLEAAMVEARRVLAKPVAAIGEQLP